MPDPDAPMDDPPPTDLAARRAERARRNGARSRGPVTERGKARSSRNALRHGLTAKVHLVLDRDDEAEFMALAGGLEGELAPRGTLEAFLVARLTAAMWHTGRAERMEARAFAAAADPDPDRLRLALRYRGSVQRELFRCLRALQELRSRPLASLERDAGGTAEPGRPAATPGIADPTRVAVAAWGGERAGPIPPGFLELRPVPQIWPIAWRFVQDRAYPGDVPLLVYADGTVRSPEGRLLDDIWSPEAPPSPPPKPAAPPSTSAPTLAPTAPATTPVTAVDPASALDWLDDEDGDEHFGDLLPTPRQRNEPTQAPDSAQFPAPPIASERGDAAPRLGLGRTAPELNRAPAESDIAAAQDSVPILGFGRLPPHIDPEPDRLQAPSGDPAHTRSPSPWERMWGVPLLETELETIPFQNDTREPDAAEAHEQNLRNAFPPCTLEPEEQDRHEEKYTNELSSCTCQPEREAETAVRTGEAPASSSLCQPSEPPSRLSGRSGRIRRRNSSWRSRRTTTPEADE